MQMIRTAKLPTYEECSDARLSGHASNLQLFIYENEPCGFPDSEIFRSGLEDVIKELTPDYQPICNLWVDPETMQYVVDHLDHPRNELIPVYDTPSRVWKGLTKDERAIIIDQWHHDEGKIADLCKAVERKLKEVNQCPD